ncbi:tyrosine-type recombinase/integrase [Streptomyces sp. NPDC051000]|uniref:tyrosine-type recombinase/integrase n=1 Tax=Streptomyces sp. NPDC051000 TaxID=3155520 RepID=UPI0033D83CA5
MKLHIRAHGTRPDGGLFKNQRGSLAARDDFGYAWRQVPATVRHEWSAHDLRHYFASTCLLNGLPILAVSRRLGHASITITADTYGHTTPDSMVQAVNVLDGIMGLAALRRLSTGDDPVLRCAGISTWSSP